MNVLSNVRGGYGLAQLAVPGVLGRVLGLRLDRAQRRVARVLGARHLTQAALSAPAPTAPVLALGVEVDLLHSASMLGLAVFDRSQRRPALTSAVVAAGFAAVGMRATREARGRSQAPAPDGSPLELRDRCAERLAQVVVPGSLLAPDYHSLAAG